MKGVGAGQKRHVDKDGRDKNGKTMVPKTRTKLVKTPKYTKKHKYLGIIMAVFGVISAAPAAEQEKSELCYNLPGFDLAINNSDTDFSPGGDGKESAVLFTVGRSF